MHSHEDNDSSNRTTDPFESWKGNGMIPKPVFLNLFPMFH